MAGSELGKNTGKIEFGNKMPVRIPGVGIPNKEAVGQGDKKGPAETGEEVRGKFIELLRRAPEHRVFSSEEKIRSKTGENKGEIKEIWGRQYVSSKDIVILFFRQGAGKSDKTKTLVTEHVKYKEGAGREVVRKADPTWKQIIDSRKEPGEFPYYVYWENVKIRATGSEEKIIERDIDFEELELDVLNEARKADPNYGPEYFLKRDLIKPVKKFLRGK